MPEQRFLITFSDQAGARLGDGQGLIGYVQTELERKDLFLTRDPFISSSDGTVRRVTCTFDGALDVEDQGAEALITALSDFTDAASVQDGGFYVVTKDHNISVEFAPSNTPS